jgi:hypothetical protein
MRAAGRDLHAEFRRLLPEPPQPIRIQRWSTRRVALLLATIPVAALLLSGFRTVLVNSDTTLTPLAINNLTCDGRVEPLWLAAQAVPTASYVPCVRRLVPGWTFARANARNGWFSFSLNHDRSGADAMKVRLTSRCPTDGAVERPSGVPQVRRFERQDPSSTPSMLTRYDVFAGGCVTTRLRIGDARTPFAAEAASLLGLTSRQTLATILEDRSHRRLHLDAPGS